MNNLLSKYVTENTYKFLKNTCTNLVPLYMYLIPLYKLEVTN